MKKTSNFGYTLISRACKGTRNAFKGYTLIELLVVIAIVSLLMGIALVAFQGTRKSARDGKRKADLEQIRSALEMCRSDTNSYKVGTSLGTSLTCGSITYLQAVPTDPVSSYTYTYTGTANAYTLCAYLENGTELSSSTCPDACTGNCGNATGSPVGCYYKVCNP